jgi:hypothetical protein
MVVSSFYLANSQISERNGLNCVIPATGFGKYSLPFELTKVIFHNPAV